MSKNSKKTGSLGHFLAATLAGLAAGFLAVALYAYGTAEWWLRGRIAGYCALALVPAATAFAALTAAWRVGKSAAQGRLHSTAPVLLAGLVVFALASVVRVYPVRELTFQLPGYIDAHPGIGRALADLERAELPLLTASLGKIFAFVYMGIEALVLLGALAIIARWSINAPFCHTCNRYCVRKTDVSRVTMAPVIDVLEHVNVRNWAYFRGLGAPRPGSDDWLRLDLATCPKCHRTATVTINMVSKRGKRVQGLVHDLKITQDDLRTVERLAPPAG